MDAIKAEIANGYKHTLNLTKEDKVDEIHDQIGAMDFASFLITMGGAKKYNVSREEAESTNQIRFS